MAATILLAAVTALHLGFQLTVTLLVYPALARVPLEQFAEAHRRHSRAITPLVVVVYGAVVVACLLALVVDPSPGVLLAAAGSALALGTTASVAAPAHGRLAAGRDDSVLRRLLVADRVRTSAALLALVGAVVAA